MNSTLATLLLTIAGALSTLAPGAAAHQDEEAKSPPCRSCKSTGLAPCSEHPKAECVLERGALYCSEVAGCEACGGAGEVDCTKCNNEGAERALEARRKQAARGVERLRWVDDTWNKGREREPETLRKAESEHFVLVWEMEGMKVDRKRLNEHQMMHLTLDRLEQVFDDYLAAFQAGAHEFTKKSVVLVWYLDSDQVQSSLRFCSTSAKNGVKLLGATPRYSVCANKQFFRDDEELHRNLAHSVGHLLLSHQRPSQWIGDKKYGWADEGVAHWFEDRYFGICTNYCYQEANTNVDFKSGKYKLAVRKMVATDDCPPVALVFSRTTQDLTLPEHAVSFSYVDYLITLDGKKFNQMMKRLRQKVPTRDALKECFEMNPLQFEEKWREWVLATYPTR